jgi:hypothetical protein
MWNGLLRPRARPIATRLDPVGLIVGPRDVVDSVTRSLSL